MIFLHRPRPKSELARQRPQTTGSNKAEVFSYYAARSSSETNRGRQEPQQPSSRSAGRVWSSLRRFLVLLGAIILLVVVGSQQILATNPKVVVLPTTDGQVFLRNYATYQQAADALFGKSFSSRSKLTIHTGGISEAMEHQFPELSSVTITWPILGHQPTVYIRPSEPALVLRTNNQSFVLNTSGRALEASSQATVASLPVVTDESGLQSELGAIVLPASDVSFIQTVYDQLRAQHFGIQRIILPAAASEVDFYIAGEPYFVKFNMQDQTGALQQSGAFVAVAQSLAAQGKTPRQYIDVRVDGRAYYK